MAYAPCKNPNCKSYGQPHPNCRCYGDMAEGGDVGPYCAKDQAHRPDCEYFADGGMAEVPADDLPSAGPMEVPQDDLPHGLNEVPADDMPIDVEEKYGTPGQQIGAGIEGLAQGIAGPLATGAELALSKMGVPGLAAEDIKGRAEANPLTHGLAEAAGVVGGALIPGVGEYTLGTKALQAGEAAAKLTKFGEIGTKLIGGAIASGALQASDEATKYMLDDPSASAASAMAHIGAAGLFGLAGGAVAAGIGKGLNSAANAIADTRIGDRLRGFTIGLGSHNESIALKEIKNFGVGHGFELDLGAGIPPERIWTEVGKKMDLGSFLEKKWGTDAKSGFDAGAAVWKKISHEMEKGASAGATIGILKGYHDDGISEALKQGVMGAIEGAVAGSALKFAGQKVLLPVSLKVLQNGNFSNIVSALNHQATVAKGVNAINSAVDSLFLKVPQQALNAYTTDQDRQKLKDYISEGGLNQNIQEQIYKDNAAPPVPQFAEGGLVDEMPNPKPGKVAPVLDQHQGVADHFPEQNVILSAARGRISNYLSSIQPQKNAPKLAFDSIPEDKQAERKYDKAIDIALKPLAVLDSVRSGQIDPEQMKHLNAMYPELVQQLNRKLTERIVKAQMDNEKPAYRTRLGMSMMLGVPLDSSMTPANIQAIQGQFAAKQQSAQQGPQATASGSKQGLDKLASQYRTPEQSRIMAKAKG